MILQCAAQVPTEDWRRMKAYAMSALGIGGDEHYHIAHPKGEDTYGEERDPPIRPDCIPFLRRYMRERMRKRSERPDLEYLFPALRDHEDGKLSTNSITKMVRSVGKDAGVVGLDLHKCRRTYGQLLSDEGAEIETVSVLLGHHYTSTTEASYSRKKQQKALRAARQVWAQDEEVPRRPGAKNPLIDAKYENTGYA